MALLAPPPAPPRVAVSDRDGRSRVYFRLWQLFMATITILATAWCCTLGAVPAILALMVAKHVLVAIVVMGLGVDAQRDVRT